MTMAIVKDPARFVETVIDDEVVVMQLDSGDFFSLSGSARAIWEAIDGTRDEAAVCAVLAGQFYDADRAGLATDVARFVARLRAVDLLAA